MGRWKRAMGVLLPASRVVPELCSWMRWHPAWLAARHCFQKPRAHAPHPGLFAHWISSQLCSLTPFRDAWRPCRGACRAFELLGCHEGCHVFFGRPWDPRNSPPLTPPRPRHRSWPPTLGVPVWDVQRITTRTALYWSRQRATAGPLRRSELFDVARAGNDWIGAVQSIKCTA